MLRYPRSAKVSCPARSHESGARSIARPYPSGNGSAAPHSAGVSVRKSARCVAQSSELSPDLRARAGRLQGPFTEHRVYGNARRWASSSMTLIPAPRRHSASCSTTLAGGGPSRSSRPTPPLQSPAFPWSRPARRALTGGAYTSSLRRPESRRVEEPSAPAYRQNRGIRGLPPRCGLPSRRLGSEGPCGLAGRGPEATA